jgi:hypothetical protein
MKHDLEVDGRPKSLLRKTYLSLAIRKRSSLKLKCLVVVDVFRVLVKPAQELHPLMIYIRVRIKWPVACQLGYWLANTATTAVARVTIIQ